MAGNDQRLKVFFEQYIKIANRKTIILREFDQLKNTMMVDQLLDKMLSQGILGSQGEKNNITGHGQGFQAPEVQAERLLEKVQNIDATKYIRFLKILNNNQVDMAKALTRPYYDLLLLGDLEKQYDIYDESPYAANNMQSASSAPVVKESGKDYAGYFQKYIALEGRETILQESYASVLKYLSPEKILPELVTKKVFTADEKDDIEEKGTETKQAKVLVAKLERMSTRKYVAFLDVLFAKEQDHVLQKLAGSKYIPGEELRQNVDL